MTTMQDKVKKGDTITVEAVNRERGNTKTITFKVDRHCSCQGTAGFVYGDTVSGSMLFTNGSVAKVFTRSTGGTDIAQYDVSKLTVHEGSELDNRAGTESSDHTQWKKTFLQLTAGTTTKH